MLFNSASFAVFFPVVTVLYFVLPHRFRWLLLLVASCVFYMAFIPAYIAILAVLIVIDYSASILIEQSRGRRRRAFLLVSILATCFVLFLFKYFGFFNRNLTALAGFLHWNYPIWTLKLILPIGLSFHTFQSLSCVIEVYKDRQKAERNFGIYALYVMFYPQLVAGPIERPQHLLHQFYEVHRFDYRRVTDGLKLMLWGLFQKVVIADRLAAFVSPVFGHPTGYTGASFIVATIFFSFQIYCDFAGYSDIAIGAAQVMGFRLMSNFRRPYFARSIAEFWRRWHISLSSWFRDYLYIPMGGSRVARGRVYLNLLITFLVSGLWHGAGWTFVVWGALHGLYVMVETATRRLRDAIARALRIDGTRLIPKLLGAGACFCLVSFAWIFFRASDIHKAFYVTGHLFSGLGSFATGLFGSPAGRTRSILQVLNGQTPADFAIAVVSICGLGGVQFLQRRGSVREMLSRRPAWFRWTCYYGLLAAVIFFGVHSKRQFIYFQF